MNKFLMALLTVSLIGQATFARSILPAVVSYSHTAKAAGGKTEQLVIYANGQVVYRPVQAIFPAPKALVIGYVSADTIDRLNRLVERAEKGVITFKPSMVMCFAPAMHTEEYRGDMGQVLLRVGAMCDGGFKVNQSRAAKTLVNYLDRLRTKFNIPGGGPKKSSRPGEIELPLELINEFESSLE